MKKKRCLAQLPYHLMVLPGAVFVLLFNTSTWLGIALAFQDFIPSKGWFGSPWVGFENFGLFFSLPDSYAILRNTMVIAVGKIAMGTFVSIVFALLLNELHGRRLKKTIQTAVYLPHFISWVIAASLITDVLALNGPINALLGMVGRGPVYFLADSNVFRGVLILTNIWKGAGWSAIIYIAAITAIDPNLYEAARVDGAKKLQEIWHITLPGIRSTILTLFILEIGKLLSSNFDQIFNLYSPAVYDVADVLDTYTYRQGLESFNFSYATAAGFFQNGIGFVLVIISNIVVKHLSSGEESLW